MTLPLQQPLKPVRLFAEDTARYKLYSDPLTDAEWAALVPGDGLVYLGEDERPYTVSVFHQLRCLDIIRKEIAPQDKNDIYRRSREHSESVHHCVNYLRQMVLCRGDTQLDVVYGRPRPVIIPDEYECLDWTVVYDAVKENQGRRQVT